MKSVNLSATVASIVLAVGMFVGCSSGGSSSDDPLVSSTLLSGTAAGGAAIVGKVCVKDALAVEKCSLIDTLGSYSIDVAGMTAPFILRAKGQVGDTAVTYYSAATEADIGSKINITPFTDMIVSNLAGEIAANYYDANSSLGIIESATLLERITALQEKLKPVLLELGLDASLDFLRASFLADHTGMDGLIDLIKVDVNTTSNVATLKNTITQVIIGTDDFTDSSDDNVSVDELLVSGLALSQTDLSLIVEKMNAFAALFATTTPSVTQIEESGIFDTSDAFMNNGQSFLEFATMLSNSEGLIGLSFSNIAVAFDSNTSTRLYFTVLDGSGNVMDQTDLILQKGDNGWLVLGNGRIASVSLGAQAGLYSWISDTNGTVMHSGIMVWIDTHGTAVKAARIYGPGLAEEGVSFTEIFADGSLGHLVSESNIEYSKNLIYECYESITTDCYDAEQVSDNAQYNVVLVDENGTTLNGEGYVFNIPTAPVKTASLSLEMFPVFTSVEVNSVEFTSLEQLVDGATVSVAWSLPAETHFKSFGAWAYSSNNEEFFQVNQDGLGADTQSTSFVIEADETVPTVTSAGMYVEVINPLTGQRYSFSQAIMIAY